MDEKIVDKSDATRAYTMGVRVFLTYRNDLIEHASNLPIEQINVVAAHLAAAEVGAVLGVTMMRQPASLVPGVQIPASLRRGG